MPELIYQPVFIIGAARSGTKLVRDIIASHPAVSKIPYDINYIWRYGNEKLPHDEISPDLLKAKATSKIRVYFDNYSSGKQVLVEKTVSNCLRVPYVQAIFPKAKYIHLIRNGWDVIESSYRQWIAPPDWGYILRKVRTYPFMDAFEYAAGYALSTVRKLLVPQNGTPSSWGPRYAGIDDDIVRRPLIEVCAIQWARCVTKSIYGLSKLPVSRVYTVQYEEFVHNPVAELTGIASFLDLDADPYLNSEQLGVSTNNIGKGRRSLNDEQRDIICGYIDQVGELLKDGHKCATTPHIPPAKISTN